MLTCILGEQNVLGLQVGVDDLVAVQEDQPPNDVQSNQVPLAASAFDKNDHQN